MTEPIDAPFTRMAAAIELNSGGNFGGAFVIYPPKGGGEPIGRLILDNSQTPAEFWAGLKTKAEIRLNELMEAERMQSTFPRGR